MLVLPQAAQLSINLIVKENQKCFTSLRDLIKDTLLRDRMKRKTSTRRELNPRPQEFHPIGMYSTTVDPPLPQIKNYLGPGDFPKMFNLLTSGYSDQLLTFTFDDVTGKIAPAGQHLTERPPTSFTKLTTSNTLAPSRAGTSDFPGRVSAPTRSKRSRAGATGLATSRS